MGNITGVDALRVDTITNKANDGPPSIAGLTGWLVPISVSDVEDAAVIGAAIVAALGMVGFTDAEYHSVVFLYILSPNKDEKGIVQGSYETGAWVWAWDISWYLGPTGAGTLYLYHLILERGSHGGGPM